MSAVLADRDINAPLATERPAADEKPKTLEYHRQVLQSRMKSEAAQQTYISPSDGIMSPCTAKLSAMKNKQIMKAKPQSLFAKTSAKNAAATGLGPDGSKQDSQQNPLGAADL